MTSNPSKLVCVGEEVGVEEEEEEEEEEGRKRKEEETVTSPMGRKQRSKRSHARQSTHLTRKETVSADFYMAEKSIDKILEWITIELLTHRPERPLLFLRDLFTKTSFEGVDVTDRKRVNNGGVEILRSQLETLNEELRSTNALTETNDDCEIKRDAIFEAGTTSLSDVVSSKSRDGAGVSATTGSSSPATPIGL